MLDPRTRDEVILGEVLTERQRQDDQFGMNRVMGLNDWFAVLTEEFGEAGHQNCDQHFATEGSVTKLVHIRNLRHELIQTAAVAVAIIDAIDRRDDRR